MKATIAHFAGMPRTGTTFFYYFLRQHPQIFVPVRKETNFFSVEYDRGEKWFRALYKRAPESTVSLDVSPLYFLDANVAKRITQFNPLAKVIVGIRQPSDWIVSAYKQKQTQTAVMPSFEKFIEHFDWNIRSHMLPVDFTPDFVSNRIEEYRKEFGENVLFYDYRELKRDPLGLLNRVEEFLGLDRHFTKANFQNKIINSSQRETNRGLNVFLAQDWVIDLITRVFPDKMIMWAKNRYFGEGSAKKQTHEESKLLYTEEEAATWRDLAIERFKEEDNRISDMFAEAPYWRGETPWRI